MQDVHAEARAYEPGGVARRRAGEQLLVVRFSRHEVRQQQQPRAAAAEGKLQRALHVVAGVEGVRGVVEGDAFSGGAVDGEGRVEGMAGGGGGGVGTADVARALQEIEVKCV